MKILTSGEIFFDGWVGCRFGEIVGVGELLLKEKGQCGILSYHRRVFWKCALVPLVL
jgi:hypothetical protein